MYKVEQLKNRVVVMSRDSEAESLDACALLLPTIRGSEDEPLDLR